MIGFPPGVRVWLATGHTDMRKGFATLALLVQERLKSDPHGVHLFCFSGSQRGSRDIMHPSVKILAVGVFFVLAYQRSSWGDGSLPLVRLSPRRSFLVRQPAPSTAPTA